MKKRFTIAVSNLHPVLQVAQSLGVDETRLLEESGINASILSSPENRFTLEQYDKLLKKGAELSGDDTFALLCGQAFTTGSGDVVTYMVHNCSNLHEAVIKYIEYQKIVGEAVQFKLLIENENAILTFKIIDHDLQDNRYILEAEAAATVKIGNEMTVPEIKYKEMRFKCPEPANTDEHRKIFNCPIKWSQPLSAIVFDKKFLDAPLKQPNPELLKLLENQARNALRKLTDSKTYTEKVIEIVTRHNFNNRLTVKQVAAEIPMSMRALQLKLSEEGTSFQQIIDELRKQNAVSYLKENTLSVSEIAYILGFSEPSVFQKAFKKWTGKTPGEYKKSLLASSPKK